MLNRWDDLRPILIAHLKKTKQTYLLIQIALDENNVEEALVLLKTSQVQGNATAYGNSYFYGGSGIDIEVARAAEWKLPRESIEIYSESRHQAYQPAWKRQLPDGKIVQE